MSELIIKEFEQIPRTLQHRKSTISPRRQEIPQVKQDIIQENIIQENNELLFEIVTGIITCGLIVTILYQILKDF